VFRKFISILLLFISLEVSKATTFLTLQSTYLGNGWFQYQMNVMNDPFFNEVDIDTFSVEFTNQIDQSTTSTNYAFNGTNGYSDWTLTNWPPPLRPFTETFLVRSSNTSWRLASVSTNVSAFGAIITGGLGWNTTYLPDNGALFYAEMSCLVPCDAADADGSPTNYIYALKLVSDITINNLIQTNGNIYGLDFVWGYDSTFLLQASMDMNNWTNVAYIWSYPPETIWTTNTPLNSYGQFFRVELAANGYETNPPPLSSALVMPSKTKASISSAAPKVIGTKFVSGKIVVNVSAQSGQLVSVEALNSHGAICATHSVTIRETSATATFDVANLPNPVFFDAITAQ
jgi:hypothetical protein